MSDLAEKLMIIQSGLKAPKNQFNKFGGYKYRNLEDIMEAAKPLLIKHKAVLTINDEIVQIGERVYVKATATFGDGSGSIYQVTAYAREAESKKGMDEAQITGSASSYARKYAVGGLFLVDDNQDPDSTNKHDKEEPKPVAKKKAKPPTVEQVVQALKLATDMETAKAKYDKAQTFEHLMGDQEIEDAYDIVISILAETEANQ